MYIGILKNKGIEVEESEALEYAKAGIKSETDKSEFLEWFFCYADEQIRNDVVDWYYSGNWIKSERKGYQ